VAITRRSSSGCTLSCVLAGLLSLPSFSFCPLAHSQAAQPGMPPGVTTVPYVYKGQYFEIRLMRGQLFMVIENGFPVVMYMRGAARPLSNDNANVALAEEAVKAYQAGTPSGDAAGASAAPAAGSAPSGAAGPATLTVDGVISLVGAGLSDDLIIAKIQKNGQAFDLSTDDMVRLKKAGASDAVMKAMMNAAPAPAPAAAAPAAAPASPLLLPRPRRLDDPVNFTGCQLACPALFRFFADDPQHLRLGSSQPDVIANAQQHGSGSAAFLDDKRTALHIHTIQQLPEIAARAEG